MDSDRLTTRSWPVWVEKKCYFFNLLFSGNFLLLFQQGLQMDNAIGCGNNHHGVWEELIPLAEVWTRCDSYAT